MKTNCYWQLLALGCWALLILTTNAKNYNVLHSFTNSPDGAGPNSGLTLLDNVLYGTTSAGGGSNNGTVFKVNSDGAGYAVLKLFTDSPPDSAGPCAGLILSSNVLYGTTCFGGSSQAGIVFQINIDGTGYTVLKQFTNSPDGAYPGPLTLSGNVLYGTTANGGSSGAGTVFKINTDGTGFMVLKHFTDSPDGAAPIATLTLSSNVLYGTTVSGGSSLGYGTIFRVNTDGTGYSVLKTFTNSPDGAYPGPLTLSGNVLYGTTGAGGGSNNGTVFKVNTDGVGYTVLKTFTNSPDGAAPSTVTLLGNVLYGTTVGGGSSNAGTIFQINTDGTGYTVLKNFTNPPDGKWPIGLMLSGNILYGTTANGGSAGYGTVFSLSIGLPLGFNQITSQLFGGTNMQLSFMGIAGGNYALDRSFTLSPANWIPQSTNLADANGNLIFTNTPDPTTNNFWRIRSVP